MADISERSLRARLSTVLLAALIGIPILATHWTDVAGTNKIATWLAAAFCLCMAPELLRELKNSTRSRHFPVVLTVGITTLLAWHYFQGPVLGNFRFWTYLAFLGVFFAMRGWYRIMGARGMPMVFTAKLLITLIALAMLSYAIIVLPDGAFRHLPVYRHIRHLNYDLSVVICLAVWYASRQRGWRVFLFVGLFMVLGYFSAWSGGRGGALAVVIFFLLLVVSRSLFLMDRRLLVPLLALAAGVILLVGFGDTALLYQQIEAWGRPTLNGASSGRLHIWEVTLGRWMESPASICFGFGPDAFIRLWLIRDIWPNGSGGYITHPHNTVVQSLLEFGLLGSATLLLLIGALVWRSLIRLWCEREFSCAKAVGATLIAMLVFSLTDGIFYHAAPLTMMVLLMAWLSLQPTSSGSKV